MVNDQPGGRSIGRFLERLQATNAGAELLCRSDLMGLVVPDQLSRALRNIIRNAVFYAGDRRPIDVWKAVPDRP